VIVKLKLDENLAERHRIRLESANHDVTTVVQQGFRGVSDVDLFELCKNEQRAVVTLDMDFSNVLAFPPEGTAGVIVLRGRNGLLRTIDRLIESLTQALETNDPTNTLWIVEPNRLRIHLDEEE
jgi:predicted nuclease of predicted toxin-antitoxin system